MSVPTTREPTCLERTRSFWSLAKLERGVDTGVELVTTPVTVGNTPIKVEATADLGLRDVTEQPLSIEHLVDVFFDIDDVVDPIEVGSETQYRVKIVNQGTETATNVQLQIGLPRWNPANSCRWPASQRHLGTTDFIPANRQP